ncbi:alkylhydroperoxidase [Flavobacterium sp. 316]|uniref:carboxymuconolactone decarboxylase family protein n=1 Tax=Flavobacterium sp. 316 TaxID=1603293 RepID=UPI0005DA675C|nr:carboxymuconolactone decarboxylase family protein [Flavobacterium sp. 316]KIX21520.1 alkylhydroperoxidase [Flavobacterium sp. 316]
MSNFSVPTRDQVSESNQAIFDNLQKAVGFVPNIYAAMAHSKNALGSYLQFSGSETSLSKKEKEVVDLAVSQLNGCRYCQSAHTAIGKMNGFTDDQIIELRKGTASWDNKTSVLAQTSKLIADKRGKISNEELETFFNAGFTKENLVDLIVAIGSITITNLFHNVTDVPIDFPIAPEL